MRLILKVIFLFPHFEQRLVCLKSATQRASKLRTHFECNWEGLFFCTSYHINSVAKIYHQKKTTQLEQHVIIAHAYMPKGDTIKSKKGKTVENCPGKIQTPNQIVPQPQPLITFQWKVKIIICACVCGEGRGGPLANAVQRCVWCHESLRQLLSALSAACPFPLLQAIHFFMTWTRYGRLSSVLIDFIWGGGDFFIM